MDNTSYTALKIIGQNEKDLAVLNFFEGVGTLLESPKVL